MKVAQLLLLVAAIALLKVNSSWGQDVVATTAAGTVSAPDAGVPTNAAAVPVRKEDSPKATGVIQAKQEYLVGGGYPGSGIRPGANCAYSGPLGSNPGEPYYVETYARGECARDDYDARGCIIKRASCGLSTGGIIAILLGILLLGLIAAVAVGIFLLKKGKLPQLMPRGGAGGTAA